MQICAELQGGVLIWWNFAAAFDSSIMSETNVFHFILAFKNNNNNMQILFQNKNFFDDVKFT